MKTICSFNLSKAILTSTDNFVESLISDHLTSPQIPMIIRMHGYSQLKKTRKIWISSSFTVNLKSQQIIHLNATTLVVSPMRMCLYVSTSGGCCVKKSMKHILTYLHVHLYAIQGKERFDVRQDNKFNVKLEPHQ